MLYSYRKATDDNPHPGRRIPRYLKTIPTLVSALGMGILAGVSYPVVSYQLKDIKIFNTEQSGLLSPVYYQSKAEDNTAPVIVTGLDYTKASSWFPGSTQNEYFTERKGFADSIPDFYSLSIPALNIFDAEVALRDEDLTKHLVQYPQTALPGQIGSPVVFGHSTLPQFFDPKKYTTIFSTLPKIKVGSDIFLKFDGIEYTYRINKTYEVKPNELWVLRQDYGDKTLKLITCVPPGTTLRRLVVEAKLVRN